MSSGGVSVIVKKDGEGAMVVTLASLARLADGEPDAEYRPVAFDVEKVRHLFELREGGWSGSAAFLGTLLSC